MDAVCFVNDSLFESSGTPISLYVMGVPVAFGGETSFGIQELRDNPEILRLARANATLARAATE